MIEFFLEKNLKNQINRCKLELLEKTLPHINKSFMLEWRETYTILSIFIRTGK